MDHTNTVRVQNLIWRTDGLAKLVRAYLIEEFYAILCGELRIRKRNENFFKYTTWFIIKISKVVVKYFQFTKGQK
jgi:hypothetical protein